MRLMNIGAVALSLLLFGTQHGWAQNTNINALSSSSNASSGSASQSSSTSGASNQGNAQNITFNTPAPPSTTTVNDRINYSGGTNNYTRQDGDVTIRNVPQVYAPPVSGGNPCTVGVSGGASFVGFGAALGGTFVDQDCADRQKIAMIHNAGYSNAAKELMCNDRKTYDAFKTVAQPCAVRPDWEPKTAQTVLPPAPPSRPAPMVMQGPSPQTTIPPATPKVYPRCDARRGINDNCQS